MRRLDLLGLFCLAVGCSSSSSAGPVKSDADASTDATADDSSENADVVSVITVVNDPDNCVKPGTPSNADGVGGYCNKNGGQCIGPGGKPTLCTADFGAPAHQWFCTVTCTTSSDCGPGGAVCAPGNDSANVCIPTACSAYAAPNDASTPEGGADAQQPADGATDAAAHDASPDGG